MELLRSDEKKFNRILANLTLKGLSRAFHNIVDLRFDGAGPVARDTGEDSSLGTLAQIERNNRAGKPPDEGLYPGQLDDRNAP